MKGKDRLNAVLKELESNPHKLATELGLSTQGLYDVQNEKVDLSGKLATKIAEKHPQFNLHWLLTGKGKMLNDKTNGKEILQVAEASAKYKSASRLKEQPQTATRKPLFNISGTASHVSIFDDESEQVEGYIDVPEFGNIVGYVHVYGNSMYPKYCNGDVVGCKELKNLEIIPYGEAYLVITEEHRMIKYIDSFDGDDKKLTLRSEHPDHKPFVIKRTDIKRLFIIKGKITRNII